MTAPLRAPGDPVVRAGDPLILFEPEAPSSAAPPFRIEVRAGEMVVLTGPAGSGKSAVLQALHGLERPEAGRALIAGQPLRRLSHRRRRGLRQALRLAYLPQTPALVSNLTVAENLLLPMSYLGERREGDAFREAVILLDAAGVGWTAALLPGELPAETRRTVALLRGLMRRPRVALLDDPLAGLEECNLAGIRPLLRTSVAAGDCAVLAAASDLSPYAGLPLRTVEITPGWQLPGAGEGP